MNEFNLTKRQMQILRLVADGLANKQIAVYAGTTESCVKQHLNNIYKTLGVHTRLQAVIKVFGYDLSGAGEALQRQRECLA